MLHAWPEPTLNDTHHKISWESVCPLSPSTQDVPLPLRSLPESVDGSVAELETAPRKRREEEGEGEGRVREEGGSLPVAARVLGAEDGVAQGSKRRLQRRRNIQAGCGTEQDTEVLRDWQSLRKRLPSVKKSRWKAAVQKAKECEEKHVEQKSFIPVTNPPSKVQIHPQEAEESSLRTKSPPKILESPKSEQKMAWRRNYYLRSRSPSPPAQPLISKTDLTEPNWVKILGSSATQVWSMVKTFRERGNHEIAASLETAAEKQAEAVLRTQQINVRQATSSTVPVPAKPVVTREPTPIRSPVRVRVRRSAPSSPAPPGLDEEEKRSSRGAESEWESEEEETSTSSPASRPPSGEISHQYSP